MRLTELIKSFMGNDLPAGQAQRSLTLEQLEDRVLFDAVPDGSLEFLDAMTDGCEAEVCHLDASESTPVVAADVSQRELVVVDRSVGGHEQLVAELLSQREVDLVYLDSGSDGAEQLMAALDGRSELSAIHLVSHGDAGQLTLGDSTITADSMATEHAELMAAIGDSLSEAGDILIYGCNFGEGETGQHAVETLASLTGADVAASDNVTGSDQLEGDWDLEVHVGEVDTPGLSAISWSGKLDPINLVTRKTLLTADSSPAVGESVIFLIHVQNTDTSETATNVSLTDDLPSGLSYVSHFANDGSFDSTTGLWTIGNIPSGQTASMVLTASVDAGQEGRTITNVVTAASGDQDDNTTVLDDLTQTLTIEGVASHADLVTTMTQTGGSNPTYHTDVMTWELTVVNSGPNIADAVSLTNLLPAGLTATVNNGVTSTGTYNSSTGLWSIGNLAVGESATLTIEGVVGSGLAGTTLTHSSTAATSATTPDLREGGDVLSVAVPVVAAVDLSTFKTLATDNPSPEEGEVVSFLVQVANTSATTATNVSLIDLMPAGMTYTEHITDLGTYNPITGEWRFASLPSGSVTSLLLTGTVNEGEAGRYIVNNATAAVGDQPDPVTGNDDLSEGFTVAISDVDLVTTTALASSDATPEEGDEVAFVISVANNSLRSATNISLEDSLPAGLTYTSHSAQQGTYNSNTGLWQVGDLAAGGVTTLIIRGTVNAGQGGQSITNITTAAAGDQHDPSTIGDDLIETVTVTRNANLVTTKVLASADATPPEGSVVRFEVRVTNNGPHSTDNISLTDLIPAGFTATANNGNVSQGSYNATTGLWSIGTLANGAFATLTLEGTVNAGQNGNIITSAMQAPAVSPNSMDPTTFGDDLTESVTVTPDIANLITLKTLGSNDSTPEEGDTVSFLINVSNTSAIAATNISLVDQLPAGLTYQGHSATTGSFNPSTGIWNLSELASGSTALLRIDATVDVGRGGTSITNTVSAAVSDQTDPFTAGDDLSETINIVANANLVTVKSLVSADSTPPEGEVVTFEISVTNNGPNDAHNVTLADRLPPGLTATLNNGSVTQGSYNATTGLWNIGTLADGETATLHIEGTVNAGQSGNVIVNSLQGPASSPDSVDNSTAGDDLTESVTVTPNTIDLQTTQTLVSGDSTPAEGDTVAFLVTVVNHTATTATNVSLTDQLPAGITYTSHSAAIGAYNAATGLWSIGNLTPGSSATLVLTGTVDSGLSGTAITNVTSAAQGDQLDPSTVGDDLTETVNIVSISNLVTTKSLVSGDSTPSEGDVVTFSIVVDNNGPQDARNVTLVDLLPAGLTPTAGNGRVTQGSYNATTGQWSIGTLVDGASATLTIEGVVLGGLEGNVITNTLQSAASSISVDDRTNFGDDLSESVTIAPNEVDLVTTKTLISGDSTPEEGDTVTFLLTVRNNSSTQATNVSLEDRLPAGLTYTGHNAAIGNYNANTGQWTIGDLHPGSSATLVLAGSINSGQSGNVITNVTTAATADQDDLIAAGDDLTESISVTAVANLSTVKTLVSGDSTPSEGDVVTYSITVTNSGPDAAPDVSLTDRLPAGLTATPFNGTATQGSYDAVTGIWSIGTLVDGATATLTIQGVVDVGQEGNTITNSLRTPAMSSVSIDTTTDGDDLSESVTVVPNTLDLVTTNTLVSGDSTPEEGDTVVFLVNVVNNSGIEANGVQLNGQLPEGITYTSHSAAIGSYNQGTGQWSLGNLPPGASATLVLTGTVDAGQSGNSITSVVTSATSSLPDPTSGGDNLTETVNVVAVANLVSVKTLASGDVTPSDGDVVTFRISVTNSGPNAAQSVTLFDRLPAGLTATALNGTATQGSYNAATGQWNIGTLDDGATATLTIEGTVDAGQTGNVITNTLQSPATSPTSIDTSSAGDALSASITIEPATIDLVTTKSLISGDNTPEEGDTVAFLLNVVNTSTITAEAVSLTDRLPAGLTYNSHSAAVGSYNPTTGLWSVGSLAAGSSATMVVTGIVDAGQSDQVITNVTSAAVSSRPDPSSAGDDLTETIRVVANANLVTVKSLASQDSTPAEGDVVTYRIAVTNNGPNRADDVSLFDRLPAGMTPTLNNGIVTQGSYNAATGQWDIGSLIDGATATLTIEGTVNSGQTGNTIVNTLQAAATSSTSVDHTSGGDDLTESVTIVPNVLDLVTTKTLISGDATPEENDTVAFLINVVNNSTLTATDVSLTDQLPAGLSYAGHSAAVGSYNPATGLWSISSLSPGASATLVLTSSVDQGQSGQAITNVATAAVSSLADPTSAGDDLTETINVTRYSNLITTKVLASADPTPSEGDVVTFQITVNNDGPNAADSVTLTDLLPNGLIATANNGSATRGSYNSVSGLWTIGTLNDGESATLTIEGIVAAGQTGNTISNVLQAAASSATSIDRSTGGDDLGEEVTIVPNTINLVTSATLISGDNTPEEGDTIAFLVNVSNSSAFTATGVSLADSLPAGLTYVSHSAALGSYNPATGLWTIGDVPANSSATLVLTAMVDAGQSAQTITYSTNAATGDQIDPTTLGDDLSESVNVVAYANLVTVKTLTSGDNTPTEGDVVTFQITVTNEGPNSAGGVSLTDRLPAGFTPTSNNGSISQGSYNAATGLWDIGTLGDGQTATLTVEGTVDAGQVGNIITNELAQPAISATAVDLTSSGDDLSESVTVAERLVDLVTRKTLISGDNAPDESDTVAFLINVSNNSDTTATGVSLTDVLPSGLTYASHSAALGTYDQSTGLWNIGNLAAGSSATLVLNSTVNVGQGGQTITNTATAATGDQVDPTTDGDDLSESIDITSNANLVTVKTLTSGNNNPLEGETVRFTTTVSNNGPNAAGNITLTDLLPPGMTPTAFNGTISQGSYNANTGVWTIGSLANGSSATLIIEGTVDSGQAGNTITNTIASAAVSGTSTDPTTAGDVLSSAFDVAHTIDLITAKSLANAPEPLQVGDEITYLIQVTNTSSASATGVSLTEQLPAGLNYVTHQATHGSYNPTNGQWQIGSVDSGSAAVLQLTAEVGIGQEGNAISNSITAATGDQFDPSTASDDLSETINVTPVSNLVSTVSLISSADPVEGDTVSWQVRVTNNGPNAANAVNLAARLPQALTATSANGDATLGSYNASTGVWNIGNLAAGQSVTMTLQGVLGVGTANTTVTQQLTSVASSAVSIDPTTAGDVEFATVDVSSNSIDLVTTKTLISGDSTPEENDTVAFLIQVKNNSADTATGVSLIDKLPAGLTYTGHSSALGAYNTSTGLWNVGTLTAGSTATLVLTGSVDAGQGGRVITNTTTAAVGNEDDPTTAGDDLSESISITGVANLITVKTLTSGDSTPHTGDVVSFQIRVTNDGPSSAGSVSVVDLLPPGLTPTANNGNVSHGSYDASSGLWSIGDLANSESAVLIIEGTVNADQAGQIISNVITSPASSPASIDNSVAGDDLVEQVTVTADALDLITRVTLASGDANPSVGETVTFNVEVENASGETATNVNLSDILPAGLTYVSHSAPFGSYNSATGNWSIGNLGANSIVDMQISVVVDAGTGGTALTYATGAAAGDQIDNSTLGDDLSETISVGAAANLVTTVTLTSGDATPLIGDVVSFEVRVRNDGPNDVGTVNLKAFLPAGITITSGHGVASSGSYNQATGDWSIPALSNGGFATLALVGTVDAGQTNNTLTVSTTRAVSLTSDPTIVGDVLSTSVTPLAPNLPPSISVAPIPSSFTGTTFFAAMGPAVNENETVDVWVTGPAGTKGTVKAGEAAEIEFTIGSDGRAVVQLNPTEATSLAGQSNNSIRIDTEEGVAVAIAGRYLALSDATLVLPVEALSTEYMGLNLEPSLFEGNSSSMIVVATEDDTRITFEPVGEASFEVTLDAGEVYNFDSENTQTGTLVKGDKRFAAFVANANTFVGTLPASDFLYEQLPPLANWASRYFVVENEHPNILRIVAETNNTQLFQDGTLIANLGAGEFLDVEPTGSHVFTATGPILIAQMTKGVFAEGFNASGDPSLAFIQAESTFQESYVVVAENTLSSQTTSGIVSPEGLVVIPTSAVDSLRVNGAAPTAIFTPFSGTEFSWGRVELDPGVNNISADEKFSMNVYAEQHHTSYAFTGGYALPRTRPILDAGDSAVIGGLTVMDIDAGVGQMALDLVSTGGGVLINASVPGGISPSGISGNGSETVRLTGTLSQINATLSDENGVTYQAPGTVGDQTLTVTAVDDRGSQSAFLEIHISVI